MLYDMRKIKKKEEENNSFSVVYRYVRVETWRDPSTYASEETIYIVSDLGCAHTKSIAYAKHTQNR